MPSPVPAFSRPASQFWQLMLTAPEVRDHFAKQQNPSGFIQKAFCKKGLKYPNEGALNS